MLIPFSKLIIAILSIFSVGTLLTLVLFRFSLHKIHERNLDTKILMWLPLAGVFLLSLRYGFLIRSCVFGLIAIGASIEYHKVIRLKKDFTSSCSFVRFYLLVFLIALCHLAFIGFLPNALMHFIYLIVGTVVSDVGGFFLGNLSKRYPLPEWINKNKSWDGVFGQFLGAFLGVLLIHVFVLDHVGSVWYFIPIGIGAVFGDLLNSSVKRILGIKNWSNVIPGHGGFIDRFCSLAGSSFFLFYFLFL